MPQAKFQINHYNKTKLTAILSFAVLFLSGVYFVQPFASDNSYAETHTDSASGAYNGTTYSMTTTVSDLNLELYNVTPAGKATYGKQTVNVTTNAPGGYQLYVQTSGNLAGTKAGTATSDSIAALPSNNSALDMNTWGYTKTTPNEDANTAADQTIWNTPPSTITQVDATSSAAASGRDTDIYYGIKADNTLSGDNYSGTITYTTIANDATTDTLLSVSPTSGNAGTATTITVTTSLMTTSSGISASDISAKVGSYTCSSVSITSTAPLKFTCNTSTSLTAGTYTVSATISKYSKTYTKTSAFTVKAGDLTGATMQDSNINTLCQNSKETTSINNVYTYEVKDSRNSQKYYVRKFAFGDNIYNYRSYCIMVENLYLVGGTILNPNTSAVSNEYTLPASSTSGFSTNSEASMYNGSRKRNGGSYDGSYYSYVAAKSGSGNGGVCPKGWHIPNDGEVELIPSSINSVGVNSFFSTSTGGIPTSPVYSGFYYYSDNFWEGNSGSYWWSSGGSSSWAYNFFLKSQDGYFRYYSKEVGRLGLSVRCLVQAAS